MRMDDLRPWVCEYVTEESLQEGEQYRMIPQFKDLGSGGSSDGQFFFNKPG